MSAPSAPDPHGTPLRESSRARSPADPDDYVSTGPGFRVVLMAALGLLSIFAIAGVIVFSPPKDGYDTSSGGSLSDMPLWSWAIVAGLGLAFLVSGLLAVHWADRGDRVRLDRVQQNLWQAEKELASVDGLTLPALWTVTQKRLDAYHEIATGQARTSFRNAQAAMVIGFTLLAMFALLAANARSITTSVVTGALGAVAAALAGYISRTFVRSQESSASHLRSYFDQPVEFSRYLAAERLLDGVQSLEAEQRAAILADLLRTVIAPDGAATGPAPSAVTINLPATPPNPAGAGGPAGIPPPS